MQEEKKRIVDRILPIIMSAIFLVTHVSNDSLESKKIRKRIDTLIKNSYFIEESIKELKSKYILGVEASSFLDGYNLAVLDDHIKHAKSLEEKNKYEQEYIEMEEQLANKENNYDLAISEIKQKRATLEEMKEELETLRDKSIINDFKNVDYVWDYLEEVDMPKPRLMLLKEYDNKANSKIGESNFDY